MEKKTINLLRNSFISIICVCIIVFIALSYILSSLTETAIVEVGNIYMEKINEQIQQKFNSVINIRMVQLNGIYTRTPPDYMDSREEELAELQTSAEVREFSTLGFLAEDGEIESVYGVDFSFSNIDSQFANLEDSGYILSKGYDSDGVELLILGIEADYQMEDGGTSVALLAGIPLEYLNEALFLAEDDSGVYFHIIDKDGDFIIKNSDVLEDDYFTRILSSFEQYSNGPTPEEFVEELKSKMESHEDCYTFLSLNGENMQIYCSPIADKSNWYLVAVMPERIIGDSLNEIAMQRNSVIFAAVAFIVAGMSVIFILYYRLTHRQLKQLNEARQEALHASRAKSEFLSSMSHDIRTPMNAIIGMTEIAARNVQDAARMDDCLKKIKLSSKHLLGLINDVLDMSKIESGKMELSEYPVSLRAIMDDIVNIMRSQVKEKNQKFDIFIRDVITEDVCLDSVRLNQVLINLLSNAVKYTQEEGRIDVYLNQEPSPKGDDYVRTHFRVVDNGVGMSEEFQKRVFETFAREETERNQHIAGSGLGMSITKSIVDLMGGTIELQSQLQKGSEFHVVLDFKKSGVKENDMKLPAWNILIVDDNEQLGCSAAASLEELGAHAEWTTSGYKAIEMIEEHHRNGDDYDLALIDWKMPDIDGVHTLQKIRQSADVKDVPIFLVSAYDWSDIEEEATSLLVEGFISKPLFKSTLYERLSQYTEEHKRQKEQQAEEIDFTGKRVLLAEDIDINWEVAYEILSPSGLAFERAENGKECVEMFEKSEIGYYDAILMDIRMPIMDGYEATKAIRKLERADKDLPIIAMTADAFSDDVQYCLNAGMNGHLAKPIDFDECMRTLLRFLKR